MVPAILMVFKATAAVVPVYMVMAALAFMAEALIQASMEPAVVMAFKATAAVVMGFTVPVAVVSLYMATVIAILVASFIPLQAMEYGLRHHQLQVVLMPGYSREMFTHIIRM